MLGHEVNLMQLAKPAASSQQDVAKLQRMFSSIAAMCSNGKKTVRFSGTGAYISDNLINLPVGDLSDPEFIDMCQGLIDHECGHDKYTPHGLKQRTYTPLKNNLINLFEDVRMEQLVFADYRAAKSNLSKTVDIAMKREWFAPPDDTTCNTGTVVNYLLHRARAVYCGQTQLDNYAQQWAEKVDEISAIRSKLDEIMHPLATTIQPIVTVEMADAVIALLEEHNQEMDEQAPSPSKSDDSHSDDNDQPSTSNEQTSNGNEGEDADDEQDQQSNSSDTSSQDDQSSQDSASQDDDNQNSNSGPSSESQDEEQDNATSSDSGSGSGSKHFELNGDVRETDLHEFIEEVLEELSNQAIKEDTVTSDLADFSSPAYHQITHGVEFDTCDVSHAFGIRGRLQRALIDKVTRKRTFDKRGSVIHSAKLSGIACGNLRVFRKDNISRAQSSAVHICVDASYSMGGEDIQEANKMAYTLSYALDGIKGVKVQTGYFPCLNGESLNIVKRFDARTNIEAFYQDTTGSTPTTEAVIAATMALVTRTEERKVLIVVTDGSPDNRHSLHQAVQQAKALGIKVLAFGLNTQCYGFDEYDAVTCQNLNELSVAVEQAISRHLF
jgi:hypothetical protein